MFKGLLDEKSSPFYSAPGLGNTKTFSPDYLRFRVMNGGAKPFLGDRSVTHHMIQIGITTSY